MVETLGEAWDRGWKLRISKPRGQGAAMKDALALARLSETIVWTHGREYPIARLAQRLKCPRCSSRVVSIQFIVPAEPASAPALPARRLDEAHMTGRICSRRDGRGFPRTSPLFSYSRKEGAGVLSRWPDVLVAAE